MDYTKVCPACRNEFTAHHLSRKFCSDECKICHNNHKARMVRDDMKMVNAILKRNFLLLQDHFQQDPSGKWDVASLQEKGFNFKYFTSTQEGNSQKPTIIYVYEFGYSFIDNKRNFIKIIL